MAGPRKTSTSAKGAPPPAPANDHEELSAEDLARGILSKEIRPRAVDVRRLAEAVLAGASAKPKKAKKDKDKPAPKKKGGKKDKKLAKIPGQQTKN